MILEGELQGGVAEAEEKRESAVTAHEDKGTQRATEGSTELQGSEPMQIPRKVTQSSAGTA